MSAVNRSERRALLLGPAIPPEEVGGLPLALQDVARELGARGWQVDTQIWAPLNDQSAHFKSTIFRSRLTWQHRSLRLATWMSRVPYFVRRPASALFMPSRYLEHASANLAAAEMLLHGAGEYDVVLLCVDGAPPGISALAATLHRRVAIISLPALGAEFTGWWWPCMRKLAHYRLHGQVHPYLYRPIRPDQVSLAIFASSRWQWEARRANLPVDRQRIIYFGIPVPDVLPRPPTVHNRILWVGRLAPEKGLHLLLGALPSIRQRLPNVTLSVVATLGIPEYRQMIMETVKSRQMEDVVTFYPAIPRQALQEAYATHDILFFHSVFAEPVALVLMEAFAAGLPVVASRACSQARLVQDRVTCLCYQPTQRESIAEAVVTLLSQPQLRQQVAANAQTLVRNELTLDTMGAEYDAVLRHLVGDE